MIKNTLKQGFRLGAKRFLALWMPLFALLLTALFSGPVIALPQFATLAAQTYHFKAGGTLEKATKAANQCILCHVAAGPPVLNPYGTSVKAALKQANTSELTAPILHSIDNQDSDGDGASNGIELASDTLPGDPKSKPAVSGGTAPIASGDETAAAPGPWSIQALLFPKHAQHPIIIHFPIALFFASLLFDALGFWKRNELLMQVGYCNLIVATLGALASIATGLLAWRFQFNGAPIEGNLLKHLLLAVITTLLLLTLCLTRNRQRGRLGHRVSRLYVAFGLIAMVAMIVTGHLGGILSGIVQ